MARRDDGDEDAEEADKSDVDDEIPPLVLKPDDISILEVICKNGVAQSRLA